MKLTEPEKKLVLEHREKLKKAKELAERQATCEHVWVWACFGHKDSAYDCKLCGAVKWE